MRGELEVKGLLEEAKNGLTSVLHLLSLADHSAAADRLIRLSEVLAGIERAIRTTPALPVRAAVQAIGDLLAQAQCLCAHALRTVERQLELRGISATELRESVSVLA